MTIVIDDEVEPVFAQLGPYCLDATPDALPLTSTNGIDGTWNPATIATNVAGSFTYTFTPDADEACATTTTMTIVVDDEVTPVFVQLGPYCLDATPDALPLTSTNGIDGTWNPATIATNVAGSFTYTFTPDADEACATTTTMTIVIDDEVEPVFAQLGPTAWMQPRMPCR